MSLIPRGRVSVELSGLLELREAPGVSGKAGWTEKPPALQILVRERLLSHLSGEHSALEAASFRLSPGCLTCGRGAQNRLSLGPQGAGTKSGRDQDVSRVGAGPRGTHIESTQDVECGPDAQVVDGPKDQRHDEGTDTVALGEQCGDGEADEDPEEQRDEWGAQHAWGQWAGMSGGPSPARLGAGVSRRLKLAWAQCEFQSLPHPISLSQEPSLRT